MLIPEEPSDPRSPYHTDDGVRQLQPSVVALVDILGFTNHIRDAAAQGELDRLLNRLGKFMSGWHDVFGQFGRTSGSRSIWEVKFFTDNIMLAHPMRPLSDSEMGSIFGSLSLFQIGGIVEEGFFVRGGVAVGDLFADETIAFGVPLIEAHDTEAGVANAPRIVLSHSARAFIAGRVPAKREHIRNSVYSHDVLQDEDGHLFLNYLEACFHDYTESPEFNWIERHRDRIAENIDRFETNPRIREKYEWAARYHNYWCSAWRIEEYSVSGYAALRARRLDEIDFTEGD